jgi:hypothetical protein
MSIAIIHVPSAKLAETCGANITIEAEYGSFVWEGLNFTAAHHQKEGPYAGSHIVEGGQPSPCNNPHIPVLTEGTIGVSHMDLDTLGGCLRAMGMSGFFGGRLDTFWALAEFVDVNGPHKLAQAEASDQDLEYIHAWWAWSQANRVFWPRDEVTDITEYVQKAADALRLILMNDEEYLETGRVWKAQQDKLNADSFCEIECVDDVILRVSTAFVNHLYSVPSGVLCQAVAAFNPRTGSITISLADPIEGVSCRELVQKLWGPEAGGHDGIAGSPRGQRMNILALQRASSELAALLSKAEY